MNNEIRWLARLGIDQGVFSRAQCAKLSTALGDGTGVADFAQALIDKDIVSDVETLEKLANLAVAKAKNGAPASDPFSDEEEEAALAPTPAPAAAPAAKAADGAAKSAPVAVGPAPKFAFDTVSTMDDATLAAGLRELLKATGRYAASDLHLSTGTRPCIRKDREISFLSDYQLKPEDSMRLNTVLLSEGQKKIFKEQKDYDYALALSASDRYRVNLMVHKNGAAGSYRLVPEKVKTLADLCYTAHLETIKKLLSYHNGLILITGPPPDGRG